MNKCFTNSESPSEPIIAANEEISGNGLILESRRWFYEQYKRAFWVSITVSFALIISICGNVIQIVSTPPPKYFALTHDLRVIELTPADQAIMSEEDLLNWVTKVICETFTFDFLNYKSVLMAVRPNYKKGAFESIYSSLKKSGNLEMIIQKRLVTKAILNGPPVIIKEGIHEGYRIWKMEIPVMISYESSQGIEASQNLIGKVIVRREDERQVPRGVLIHQVILRNR